MLIMVVGGHITQDGKLEVELPKGLPYGNVQVVLQIPTMDQEWCDAPRPELLWAETSRRDPSEC